jgi:hypothetical protein
MRAGDIDFGKNESGLFVAGGLDRWNRVETACEISFLAHAIFVRREGFVVRSVDQNGNRFARRVGTSCPVVAALSPPSWPGVVLAIHAFRQTS